MKSCRKADPRFCCSVRENGRVRHRGALFLVMSAVFYDLHLRPGSPALDAAAAEGASYDDRAGQRRPQGPAVDIGAFEGERQPPTSITRAYRRGGLRVIWHAKLQGDRTACALVEIINSASRVVRRWRLGLRLASSPLSVRGARIVGRRSRAVALRPPRDHNVIRPYGSVRIGLTLRVAHEASVCSALPGRLSILGRTAP